jgi:hypothetical protein
LTLFSSHAQDTPSRLSSTRANPVMLAIGKAGPRR